jgi:hypothetical protein
MKIVINTCFGGFSLSPRAVARLAALQGKPCFFFTRKVGTGMDDLESITLEEAQQQGGYTSAFTIPNPSSVIGEQGGQSWAEMSMDERIASNLRYEAVSLNDRPEDRANPLLIQTVEELGEAANGRFAELKVIEIPDGVEWEINEYDGVESVHEKHRSWN